MEKPKNASTMMMMATLSVLRRRPTWLLRDMSSCFPLQVHAFVTQQPQQQHRPQQPLSSRHRWLSSISRMLNLGGAPSSATDKNVARTVNASKNCRLRAIVFDLATLTRSIDDANASPPFVEAAREAAERDHQVRTQVQPDVSKVEAIANVLKVTLGGSSHSNDAAYTDRRGKWDRDDLSLLTGTISSPPSPPPPPTPPSADIRAKYASKLSGKGAGTIESVELARQQAEDSLKRGDAGGHWAARKLVGAPSPSLSTTSSGTKWMARTGTGRLLQYLTQRSIRIALVPSRPDLAPTSSEGDDMTALQRQLQDVVFDALVPPDPEMPATAASILSRAFERLGRDDEMAVNAASAVLLVSSRQDYLRVAKERGWMTCHVRPKNGPRGNVSTNYAVETVPDVRQAVDEINGISYSAVLNAR